MELLAGLLFKSQFIYLTQIHGTENRVKVKNKHLKRNKKGKA